MRDQAEQEPVIPGPALLHTMAFRMEGTTGPAEIAHCQEPGRTGPGLLGQDVAAAGLHGPNIPRSHTLPPLASQDVLLLR